MESMQRDGLAKVNVVDAFRLPVRQNNNTCFCTVSLPTTDLNFLTPPPKKKINFVSYLRKPDETRGTGGIVIGVLSMFSQKGLTLTLYSVNARPKGPNDLFNQSNIDSLIKKIQLTDPISFWHETVNILLKWFFLNYE